MGAEETEVEMVQRHIREGESTLANHRALIARLKAFKQPTEIAESLLEAFENTQEQHKSHLARITSK